MKDLIPQPQKVVGKFLWPEQWWWLPAFSLHSSLPSGTSSQYESKSYQFCLCLGTHSPTALWELSGISSFHTKSVCSEGPPPTCPVLPCSPHSSYLPSSWTVEFSRETELIGLQSALHIYTLHTCRFNQPWTENIWGKKCYVIADVYCVVRPMMVAPLLTMCRLFGSLFPKQCSLTTVYIAFTLY